MIRQVSRMPPDVQECAVCWHTEPTIQYHPCAHHICRACTMQNLRYRQRCPLCRTIIEYCDPTLVEGGGSHTRALSITGQPNKMLGITFRCADDAVQVHRARGTAKRLGMRKGDVLHSINGMPCYNTECVLELFSRAKATSSTLLLALSPPPPPSKPARGRRHLLARLRTLLANAMRSAPRPLPTTHHDGGTPG